MTKITLRSDDALAKDSFEFVSFLEKYGVLLFLILLIILFTAYNPRFLSPRNITNILTEVSIQGYAVLPWGLEPARPSAGGCSLQ
jgi:inositol transport system permease protein